MFFVAIMVYLRCSRAQTRGHLGVLVLPSGFIGPQHNDNRCRISSSSSGSRMADDTTTSGGVGGTTAVTGVPEKLTIPSQVYEQMQHWRELEIQRLENNKDLGLRIDVERAHVHKYLREHGIDSIKGLCYLSHKQHKPTLTWELIDQVWKMLTAAQEDQTAKQEMEGLQTSFMAHLRATQNEKAVSEETVELYKSPKPKPGGGQSSGPPKRKRRIVVPATGAAAAAGV